MAGMTTSPGPMDCIGTFDDHRVQYTAGIHLDSVYSTLIGAAHAMEEKLATSLKNYNDHPDVQANLQQLQYDLQQWNLALTTMTNIQKNMADGLASIASNFR